MKIPRDLTGSDLAKLLTRNFNYEITRQKGSHIRMTTPDPLEHHITVPNHAPLRIGTLNAILGDVAEHLGIEKSELVEILFG